jgi:hypothetical protein
MHSNIQNQEINGFKLAFYYFLYSAVATLLLHWELASYSNYLVSGQELTAEIVSL